MNTPTMLHHYNPDWLSDDDIVANFIARQRDFEFLRDELQRVPLHGTVQHYLLVGQRGAGKTTLLKRLAAAIRRDESLKDHLVAISFPEELYDVKSLGDFWWAACTALVDELDRQGAVSKADALMTSIEEGRASRASQPEQGLKVLQAQCQSLQRRPVLLVDNLDFVFERIDKSGRKLKDPHATAYWALREVLSTATAPVVIGGTVRLSEPFTDYDKAFYDFFLPKRLAKLSLEEMRRVLDHLADVRQTPEVKARMVQRPARIEALYELTGGNPRALGLLFELLRQGPNGRAVDDFTRLMDLTTPYYKARLEDLSEQAQVVMHALAVRRPSDDKGLRFGHTAAEIATHTGLPTGTVSAQMDGLCKEGLVEKSATQGRTQYRIAEQLFRLWLQMRSHRRIRQSVLGLTEFLEVMYDQQEMTPDALFPRSARASALGEAMVSFAASDGASSHRKELEAYGVEQVLHHCQENTAKLEDYLASGELQDPENRQLFALRQQLQTSKGPGLSEAQQTALLGAIELSLTEKQQFVAGLGDPERGEQTRLALTKALTREAERLARYGVGAEDLALIYQKRATGLLQLPSLKVEEAELAVRQAKDAGAMRLAIWRLVGARRCVKIESLEVAEQWLSWARIYGADWPTNTWTNWVGSLRLNGYLDLAEEVLAPVEAQEKTAAVWFERAALLEFSDAEAAEAAYRQAIVLDEQYVFAWCNLGYLYMEKLACYREAEEAFLRAAQLDGMDILVWAGLGDLYSENLGRYDAAEAAYRRAIAVDETQCSVWNNLGILLGVNLKRNEEAEAAFLHAIGLENKDACPWNNLGVLYSSHLGRYEEAEAAYRQAIMLDEQYGNAWNNLGLLYTENLNRFDDAKVAYRRAEEIEGEKLSYWWQERHRELGARIALQTLEPLFQEGRQLAFVEALTQWQQASQHGAAELVTVPFVEGFLAQALRLGKGAWVLEALRAAGLDRYARPLLLAVTAAVENQGDRLVELEPEVQDAATRLYRRLTKKP